MRRSNLLFSENLKAYHQITTINFVQKRMSYEKYVIPSLVFLSRRTVVSKKAHYFGSRYQPLFQIFAILADLNRRCRLKAL